MIHELCRFQLADHTADVIAVHPGSVKAVVPLNGRYGHAKCSILLLGDTEMTRLEVVGSVEESVRTLQASEEAMRADWA